MVKIVRILMNDIVEEFDIFNIEEAKQKLNINNVRLIKKYKYDDETLEIYGDKYSINSRFNINTLPYYFNMRYIPSDIIIVARDNESNDLLDFGIEDYNDIKNPYENSDSEDEDFDIDVESSVKSDDDYVYDDFVVHDDDYL